MASLLGLHPVSAWPDSRQPVPLGVVLARPAASRRYFRRQSRVFLARGMLLFSK